MMCENSCCHHCKKKKPGCRSTCVDWCIESAFHDGERDYQNYLKEIENGLIVETRRVVKIAEKRSRSQK